MTAQHLEDLIRAQRKLLWMLPSEERERHLEEVRADYLYEEQLAAVADAVNCDEPSPPTCCAADPFGLDHDCDSPDGHEPIAISGEVVCFHCARIAWQ